jgi:hypothetical protein
MSLRYRRLVVARDPSSQIEINRNVTGVMWRRHFVVLAVSLLLLGLVVQLFGLNFVIWERCTPS